jgi:hypothetical protein
MAASLGVNFAEVGSSALFTAIGFDSESSAIRTTDERPLSISSTFPNLLSLSANQSNPFPDLTKAVSGK